MIEGDGEKVKYSGVSFDKEQNKWVASIVHSGMTDVIGKYDSAVVAARAVNDRCIELGIPEVNPSAKPNPKLIFKLRAPKKKVSL